MVGVFQTINQVLYRHPVNEVCSTSIQHIWCSSTPNVRPDFSPCQDGRFKFCRQSETEKNKIANESRQANQVLTCQRVGYESATNTPTKNYEPLVRKTLNKLNKRSSEMRQDAMNGTRTRICFLEGIITAAQTKQHKEEKTHTTRHMLRIWYAGSDSRPIFFPISAEMLKSNFLFRERVQNLRKLNS